MDPEIIALVRETVASVMRDLSREGGEVEIADDMFNQMSSSAPGGEGFDSSGSGMCGAFAFESGEIKAGGVYLGRKFKQVEGITIPDDFTGYAYVKVPMAAEQDPEVKTDENDVPEPTRFMSYMWLYKFKDGSVEEDYRGAPQVQMWEILNDPSEAN